MMNLGLAGTKGRMLRDLQVKKDAATIMSKVHGADSLFEPLRILSRHSAPVSRSKGRTGQPIS